MRRWDDSAFFELILITTWFSQVSDLIHELFESRVRFTFRLIQRALTTERHGTHHSRLPITMGTPCLELWKECFETDELLKCE